MINLMMTVLCFGGDDFDLGSTRFRNPDGPRYACYCGDQIYTVDYVAALRVWNAEGTNTHVLHPKIRNPNCIQFVSEKGFIVAGQFERIAYFPNCDSKEITLRGHQDMVTSIKGFRDSGEFYSSGLDGTVFHWTLNGNDSFANKKIFKSKKPIYDFAILPESGSFFVNEDGTLLKIDLDTGASEVICEIGMFSRIELLDSNRVIVKRVDLDDYWLSDVDASGSLEIVDVRRKESEPIKGIGECGSYSLSKKRDKIFASHDGYVSVIDTTNLDVKSGIFRPQRRMSAIQPNFEETQLVLADGDLKIDRFDLTEFIQVITDQGHDGYVDSILFLSESEVLSLGGKSLKIWDLETRQIKSSSLIDKWNLVNNAKKQIGNKNGITILGGSWGRSSLMFWDVNEKRLLNEIIEEDAGRVKHWLEFNPAGSHALMEESRNRFRLFDAKNWKPIFRFRRFQTAFSNDQQRELNEENQSPLPVCEDSEYGLDIQKASLSIFPNEVFTINSSYRMARWSYAGELLKTYDILRDLDIYIFSPSTNVHFFRTVNESPMVAIFTSDTFYVLDLEQGKIVNEFAIESKLRSFTASEKSGYLAYGLQDGNVFVLSKPTGDPVRKFHFSVGTPTLEFSPSGNILAIGRDDGVLSIRNLNDLDKN